MNVGLQECHSRLVIYFKSTLIPLFRCFANGNSMIGNFSLCRFPSLFKTRPRYLSTTIVASYSVASCMGVRDADCP